MPSHPNTLIGHVLQVRGNHLLAKLLEEDEGFQPTVKIGSEEHPVGQIGTFAQICHGKKRMLAIVRHIEAPPGRFPRSAAGCLITLIPLGEVLTTGVFQRSVRHYPTPGAEVHGVAAVDIGAIFAKHRSQRFNVGYLPNYPSTAVYLDAAVMFSGHFAILGQSGSGKSWSVSSLIQNAVKVMPNAHIVLLDLHGEYYWKDDTGAAHSAFDPAKTRYLDARYLEIPYWVMTFAELVELLVDPNESGAALQTAFLREIVQSLKQKAARAIGLESVSIDAPVYFSLAEVYKSFKEANESMSDFGKTRGPLFGQFDKMLIKMMSRMEDVRYDFLLNPKRRNNSQSLAKMLQDFVGLGGTQSQITVINLSAVPFDVLPMVTAQIGRLAFEFNYWNPKRGEFPLLLVCEEAHSYLPRETAHLQFEGTRRSMERIAKEGRKYGVGLGVVTQRPHDLSEAILSQCGTFICLRITNPDDQAYIRKMVPEGEGDLLDILSTLDRGEAVVLGDATPLPVRFQVFKPDPPPGGGDASFNAWWLSGTADMDVDAIVERWRRQGR